MVSEIVTAALLDLCAQGRYSACMAVQLDCEGVITWILPSDNADEGEELSSCQETVKPDIIE